MGIRNSNGQPLVVPGEAVFEARDVLVDGLIEDLPLLLKILRARDKMLQAAERAAKTRGWRPGCEALETFIERLGHVDG